jgi:hypothetical protein
MVNLLAKIGTKYNHQLQINKNVDFKFSPHDTFLEKPSSSGTLQVERLESHLIQKSLGSIKTKDLNITLRFLVPRCKPSYVRFLVFLSSVNNIMKRVVRRKFEIHVFINL